MQPIPEPPAQIGTPEDIKDGGALFRTNCASCHGNAERAPIPDLRRSSAATHSAFQQIVRGGALQPRGMPRWDDLLTEAEVDKIHAFIISVARDAYAQQQGTVKATPASGLLSAHP